MKTNEKRKSGYVALIGRTNVGKSTFLNRIMETKVSIVSDKPQTTRKQILGIKTTDKGQIVFFDSPGIHIPQYKLNERMMKDVHNSLLDADVILYFIDVADKRKDSFIIDLIKNSDKPAFIIINKIDKFKKSKALDRINDVKDVLGWAEIVPISALTGVNVELLEDLIFKYLPEGENFYSEEEYTLQSEKFFVSELIREKVLNLTRDELPFTTFTKVHEITDKAKVVYIRAEIFVETKSQKKIVVGNKASLIKQIGETGRKDLEDYFDKKVFLELFVKVAENWRNSSVVLAELE
jgi:GTP-binding protein Era